MDNDIIWIAVGAFVVLVGPIMLGWILNFFIGRWPAALVTGLPFAAIGYYFFGEFGLVFGGFAALLALFGAAGKGMAKQSARLYVKSR